MPATAQEIHDRLDPKHLMTASEEELKAQVAETAKAVDETPDPDAPDPRGEKKYTFQINYTDARGKVWKGQFTNHILSISERQQVGVMRSILGGGRPLESLDALTVEINLMVAHMMQSLDKRPDWAKNLRTLEDPGLLQAIYTEVDSHESFFLGWGKVTG
jgi:hypothetical protein